jgi:23S rRNA (guanosine2251-2'-O)-methyltransferase
VLEQKPHAATRQTRAPEPKPRETARESGAPHSKPRDAIRVSRAPEHKPREAVRESRPPEQKPRGGSERGGPFWLYGFHAARAALANPRRGIKRAVLTKRAAAELGTALLKPLSPEWSEADVIGRLLPAGAVHQGVALLCEPLPDLTLEEILLPLPAGKRIVAVLDQITDPHNEGAILRSAAAFGVAAIVVQERHGPPETGALAKAASGALDLVPRVTVVNIARALEELGRLGFWRIALAGDGEAPIGEAAAQGDLAVVLGAEGSGLRRLVRERCDIAAFIPMAPAMESLNVSNAAAIAFYALRRTRA